VGAGVGLAVGAGVAVGTEVRVATGATGAAGAAATGATVGVAAGAAVGLGASVAVGASGTGVAVALPPPHAARTTDTRARIAADLSGPTGVAIFMRPSRRINCESASNPARP
jgi:hypothetical protein